MKDLSIAASAAEEFEHAAEERRRQGAELLTLPSGLTVLARRPKALVLLRLTGQCVEGNLPGQAGELLAEARLVVALVQETVVEPRIGTGEGELHPDWIADRDLYFLVRYAGGQDVSNG